MILPPSRPTNDAAGRIFLIFVDDLHLDFRNTGRIRELFKKISKELIHEGDMFGIVSTGPSSIAIDMTYDRKRLDEAINKITGNGLKPDDIIEGAGRRRGPTEVRYRAHVAFSTALRHADEAREGAQPAQGGDLRQQRLRLQPVREVAAKQRRAIGMTCDDSPDSVRRAAVSGQQRRQERHERHESVRNQATSSPTPTWRASSPS